MKLLRFAVLLGLCLLLCGCTEELPAQTTLPTTAATEPSPTETTPPTTEYIGLTLHQDTAEAVDTSLAHFTLSGFSDPNAPLTVNGTAVERNADGSFSYECPLVPGDNTVTVSHKEDAASFRVYRRYCLQYFTPDTPRSYCSDATVYVRAAIRDGSTVTAQLAGIPIELTPATDQLGTGLQPGFVLYDGQLALPEKVEEEFSLGSLELSVTCDGITESYSSGELVCLATPPIAWGDPAATPEGYRNVGSGYIAEIIDVSVETFNGDTNDDYSHPTYNYLPEGTVDYVSASTVTNADGIRTKLLRCGVRVYERSKNTPHQYLTYVIDCYRGTLPNENTVNVAAMEVRGHHSYLTLDVAWKAPFYFDFESQEYEDARFRKYTVEEFTATYVDITFCYATAVTGVPEIGDNHPLFSGCEWIVGAADHTLRLYLKNPGGLYGWDAYYNENDQLVFQFLNPVSVQKSDNPYGVDLTGVTVMLDVGHGGLDVGASGRTAQGNVYSEAERNVAQALLIRRELESMGATVVMNRQTNEDTVTQRERIRYLKEVAPDLCLAIHHNGASDSPGHEGFEIYYFTTYSNDATRHIFATTEAAQLYRSHYLGWHFYYVARQTVCPIVLVEGGYMSNPYDMERIADEAILQQKAQAIAQGVANYFLARTEALENS